MSDFTTAQDLLKYALRAAGEIDDGNSPLHATALEYLNAAYLKILSGSNEFDLDFGAPFVWARSSKTLILKPYHETGTITLTNGSTSGTFSSAPSSSLADYDLHPIGNDITDWFLITAHTAATTSFTLDGAFTGETGSYNYKAIKLRYTIGTTIIRMVEPFRVYRGQVDNNDEDKIWGMDINVFRKKFPLRLVEQGIPTYFSEYYNSNGTVKVIMNKYVDREIKVDLETVDIPTALSDSSMSIPIIPRVNRQILGYLTASMILKDEKKQYEDADKFYEWAKVGLKSMVLQNNKKNQQTGKNRGMLLPRI